MTEQAVVIQHYTQPYKSLEAAGNAYLWLRDEYARAGCGSKCFQDGRVLIILRAPDKPISPRQLWEQRDLPVLLDDQSFVLVDV